MGINEKLRDESGQAIFEYVLLLSVIVGLTLIAFRWVNQFGFAEKLAAPLTGSYANVYKYGHPKAKGPDEGGPEYHPALPMNENRFFINPK